MSAPKTDELRRLLHDLRGEIGSFVIRLAILDGQEMSGTARNQLDAMLANIDRMVRAVACLTSGLGLEVGKSTPLAILHSRHTQQSLAATAD
jgi:hypothetical protein